MVDTSFYETAAQVIPVMFLAFAAQTWLIEMGTRSFARQSQSLDSTLDEVKSNLKQNPDESPEEFFARKAETDARLDVTAERMRGQSRERTGKSLVAYASTTMIFLLLMAFGELAALKAVKTGHPTDPEFAWTTSALVFGGATVVASYVRPQLRPLFAHNEWSEWALDVVSMSVLLALGVGFVGAWQLF